MNVIDVLRSRMHAAVVVSARDENLLDFDVTLSAREISKIRTAIEKE